MVRQQGHRQQQRSNAVPLAMAVEAADSNGGGGGGMTEMIVVQTEEGEDEEGGTTTTKTVQLQVDESGHVTFKTE